MMELLFRNCETSDFEDVFKLLKQLWPENKIDARQSRQVYKFGINSNSQVYICAIYDSRIIGFCSLTIKNNLWLQGNLGHVDELIIDEQYRGKGIGGQLLTMITQIASNHNCKRIELDSAFHRIKAHEFYIDQGFENRAFLFSKLI